MIIDQRSLERMEQERNTFRRRGNWIVSELERVGGSKWDWIEADEVGKGGQELKGVDGSSWE